MSLELDLSKIAIYYCYSSYCNDTFQCIDKISDIQFLGGELLILEYRLFKF